MQLSQDGDGTVPLLSLGALCAGGWRTRRLNPSGARVVLREYLHRPAPVSLTETRCDVCVGGGAVVCACIH